MNHERPITACVSNSGRYVITIGDWRRYERVPIVVYGVKGTLVNAYDELQQVIDTSHFVPELPGSIAGERIPHSESGWHWFSRSLMFFGPNDDYFVMRLRNRDILVFETETGRLVDNDWKERNAGVCPDKIRDYEGLKDSLTRLVVLKALRLASSDLPKDREDGRFVLTQCKDRDSINVLEQALKDPTSKIVNTSHGEMREYPIRKAAKEALEAAGEKIPENAVTEEKTGTKKGR